MANQLLAYIKICFLLIFFIFAGLQKSVLYATPFPVVGDIYNATNEKIGKAHVYPRYVEIANVNGTIIGKVGILVEEGIAKLFLVKNDETKSLIGYTGPSPQANQGTLIDRFDKIKGYYYWTPTWSFIYTIEGKRAGKVKCIAWPRVCAAGVGGFLLNFFDTTDATISTNP